MSKVASALHDRSFSGYCGKWRYRVTVRDMGDLAGRVLGRHLFRRRTDAAKFAAWVDTYGLEQALGLATSLDSWKLEHTI